jgi:GalNAc-alpha-(1->4)-GalNAc-alpha-(1->3)-diNAcBac-PP-undecaprenol alpha-1,4-N-acetyl-D-galactosaminyltransferase
MRFLFVIDNLNTGGAQRQLVNLALGLKQRGYLIEFFCYAPGDMLALPLHDAGIKINWHFKRSRFSPDVILALRKLMAKGKFDLVLSFLTTPNFYALIAGRMLNQHKMPVIVSERSYDLPNGISLIERFARQFYRLASHVVTNSPHQQVKLANQYPWLKNHLSSIYNGYDLKIYVPVTDEPDNRPIKILMIANVVHQKNGLCLAEALNILKHRDGLYPVVDWIGQKSVEGNQEYLNQIIHLIQINGLESQWKWLGLRSDIIFQLHEHYILVHPSYIEGLPNVVCEALACSRPVIVSDIPAHSYLIQNGNNGFLFDHRNPVDLADKIKMFINLPLSERQKMGASGRKFAEANLSLERFADDFERLFLSVMER